MNAYLESVVVSMRFQRNRDMRFGGREFDGIVNEVDERALQRGAINDRRRPVDR
ncbi:MAG: hypothetical protein ACI8T1_002225 [Verrucomicrobiales bacterium]